MAHRSLATLICVLALAGCGGDETTATDDAASPTTPPPATTAGSEAGPPPSGTVVRLYYLDGEKLQVVLGLTEPTQGVAADSLRLLFDNEEANQTAIPAGTELLGLSVAGGEATVDLSREFESGGGSASMQARVAQVVFTLTQWPDVIHTVSFRLDGEDVDAIGGEGVKAQALTRNDFEDVLPAILVETPVANTFAVSPLTVAGSASVFEANVSLRVEDESGRTLGKAFATALEGAPGRGPFEATIEFEVDEPTSGVLVAFEASAADGSETNVVRVPLRLCPAGSNAGC